MEERIVALIDMDCFYVQVEERDNPFIKGVPAAVVQYNTWKGGGIIAVNYEARACGVKRGMRGQDAREKCPSIQLVQVPVSRDKADLSKYRNAGKEVVAVLCEFSDCVERASIDEAYIDFTAAVNAMCDRTSQSDCVSVADLPGTWVVGYDEHQGNDLQAVRESGLCRWFEENGLSLDCDAASEDLIQDRSPSQSEERKLALAARLCENMRARVLQKTGFKCSAGISSNKMLSKLACGLHKPNQQTILPMASVPALWSTTSVTKVRNLGGKLGESLIEDFGCKTMSDLAKIPPKELKRMYDDKTARWLISLGQGIDTEPVTARQLPKSVGCGKNFNGKEILNTAQKVKMWAMKLCEELSERLIEDNISNGRIAKTLTVSVRLDTDRVTTRSCSCPAYNLDKISRAVLSLISSGKSIEKDEPWRPAIKNISLSAGKFEDVNSGSFTKIDSIFKKVNASVNLNESSSSSRSTQLCSPQTSSNVNCIPQSPDIKPMEQSSQQSALTESNSKQSSKHVISHHRSKTINCETVRAADTSNNDVNVDGSDDSLYEDSTDEDDESILKDSGVQQILVDMKSKIDGDDLPEPLESKADSSFIKSDANIKTKQKKRSISSPKDSNVTPKQPKNSFFARFLESKNKNKDQIDSHETNKRLKSSEESDTERSNDHTIPSTSSKSRCEIITEESENVQSCHGTNPQSEHLQEYDEAGPSTVECNSDSNTSETFSVHDLFPDLENIDPSVLDILPKEIKDKVHLEVEKFKRKNPKHSGQNYQQSKKSVDVNNEVLSNNVNVRDKSAKIDVATMDNYEFCKECNRRILKSSILEHRDYHFAMDLRKEQLNERRSAISSTKNIANQKRGKATNTKSGNPKSDKSLKIDAFFKPK